MAMVKNRNGRQCVNYTLLLVVQLLSLLMWTGLTTRRGSGSDHFLVPFLGRLCPFVPWPHTRSYFVPSIFPIRRN